MYDLKASTLFNCKKSLMALFLLLFMFKYNVMKRLIQYCSITVMALLLCVACKKDSTSTTQPGQAGMQIMLTDAPGDYDAVYIDVQGVMINMSENDNGWVTLSGVRPGMYNLLDLTNGLDTLIVDAVVAPGTLHEIRLLLGPNSYIVVDGQNIALKTPSAEQSGLKVKFSTVLTAGVVQIITIDFDADKSIVKHGNGDYHLKPVLRAFINSSTGAILGDLDPDVVATISATSGIEEGGSVSNFEGKFVIGGLKAGVYTVTITPSALSGLPVKVITNVVVSAGRVTNLGEINIEG